MPQRPIRSLAAVGVLALGDYLLWNWSLAANHDVVALVAGMTLVPLLIAFAWLLVVGALRLVGHIARQSRAGAARHPLAAPTHSEDTSLAAGRATAASTSSKLAA